jgi:YmgG-like glycine-zipper protein
MKILAGFLVAIALAACSRGDAKREDSSLARDLALANQAQAGQPQFTDTTMSGASVRRAPARIDNPPRTRTVSRSTPAQAGAPVSASRAIAAGASFALASQQKLCTSSNRPGERFGATVTGPVVGSNGAVVPAGATMVLEVASVDAANSAMSLRVISVEFNGMGYPVSGDAAIQTPFERTRIMADPNADKKKVIGGAIAGAIIGQLIGHNTKGTVIGAAAGGATGAVVAKAGEQYESCVPIDTGIRVTLSQPLILQ